MCEHKRQQQVSHLDPDGAPAALCLGRGDCCMQTEQERKSTRPSSCLTANSKKRPFHLQTFQRMLLLSRNLRQIVSLSLQLVVGVVMTVVSKEA